MVRKEDERTSEWYYDPHYKLTLFFPSVYSVSVYHECTNANVGL